MTYLGAAAGFVLILVVLIDAFEVLILPRRVAHALRLAILFYRGSWRLWRRAAASFPAGRKRNGFLGVFGPLSLFGILVLWANGLVAGFALVHYFLGTVLHSAHPDEMTFSTYWYFSGTTFFTLGYGDLVPSGAVGRALSVFEAGLGFGFLAVVISYLPILYQAFSRREATISLLDARAGSPPSAGELLRRAGQTGGTDALTPLLAEWERWSAELLESHLSYPVLSYYRSQHDNQSWVATLTVILDASASLVACRGVSTGYQARLTFAMARHAAVDLSLIFRAPPRAADVDRLAGDQLARLLDILRGADEEVSDGTAVTKALSELRGLYEPFVAALAAHFLFALPAFMPEGTPVDNWQSSAWMPRSPGLRGLPGMAPSDEHFG